MAHIEVPEGLPGMAALLAAYPDSGIAPFTIAVLRGPSPLTPAERELIAAYVSSLNQCTFCANTHAAVARELMGDDRSLVDAVRTDLESAPTSDKMRALLRIAGKVQQSGTKVLPSDVDAARNAGANDHEIHDTVLVAAAFCMFNRYVDGLGAWTPDDGDPVYDFIGQMIATQGYEAVAPS